MTSQLPHNANPAVFTYQTGAPYIPMTVRQLQEAVRSGQITYIRVGQGVRFRKTDLDEYIERNTVRASA
ncbi:hypothetical protein GCM10027403_14900 [Arthrobacter tecti]